VLLHIEGKLTKKQTAFAICIFVVVTEQNYNSLKNKTISNIQRAIPPKIVANIVNIAIILNGCL
jgi:hypothetical protein